MPHEAGFLERCLQLRTDLGQEFLLIAAGAFECALDDAIALGIEALEAKVLELQLHGVQPEPFGHRRVNVECFARDLAALGGRQRFDRAQVMGAVGELDQDHAQVAHHREQHLAEVLRLRLLAILETDLVQLGNTVDDFCDIVAEARRDIRLGDRRVFDDIVQDGPDDGVRIQMQVGQDDRGGHRMRDVGFARNARLALMRGRAEFGRGAHAFDLLRRQVGRDFGEQLLDARSGALRAGQQP
jgi:hypothetical protein